MQGTDVVHLRSHSSLLVPKETAYPWTTLHPTSEPQYKGSWHDSKGDWGSEEESRWWAGGARLLGLYSKSPLTQQGETLTFSRTHAGGPYKLNVNVNSEEQRMVRQSKKVSQYLLAHVMKILPIPQLLIYTFHSLPQENDTQENLWSQSKRWGCLEGMVIRHHHHSTTRCWPFSSSRCVSHKSWCVSMDKWQEKTSSVYGEHAGSPERSPVLQRTHMRDLRRSSRWKKYHQRKWLMTRTWDSVCSLVWTCIPNPTLTNNTLHNAYIIWKWPCPMSATRRWHRWELADVDVWNGTAYGLQ